MKNLGFVSIPMLAILLLISFLLEQMSHDSLAFLQLKQREVHITNAHHTLLYSLLISEPKEYQSVESSIKRVPLKASLSLVLSKEEKPLYQLNHFFTEQEGCQSDLLFPLPYPSSSLPKGFHALKSCEIPEFHLTNTFRTKGNLAAIQVTMSGGQSSLTTTGFTTIEKLEVQGGPLLILSGGGVHIAELRSISAEITIISLSGEIQVNTIIGQPRLFTDAHGEKVLPPHISLEETTLVPKSFGWIKGIHYGD